MRKRKRLKSIKFFISFLFVIFIFVTGIFYFLSFNKDKEKVATRKTIYPTLYSNKHITQNAIITDPKFKNTVIIEKENFLANALSSTKTINPTLKTSTPENGTWLWTPTFDITPSYRNSIIWGAKKNGIKNIYLSIDSYLDVFVMPDGPEKNRKKKDFDEIIIGFIKEAEKNNITVDAEAGWQNWSEKENWYKAFAVLDYAIEFNKTHSQKFRGFQYDVEPYLLPEYQKNKKVVLRNFISLINQSLTKLDGSDLEFSVVIPEFYNGENGETPRFLYARKYDHALDHLLSALERRPQSKIIVMSYRNFSLGEDGSIEISKDEINAANKKQTKIIIAQETGDVLPDYITFYNTSKSRYKRETEIIKQTFSSQKSYGGLATHYLNSFMELR